MNSDCHSIWGYLATTYSRCSCLYWIIPLQPFVIFLAFLWGKLLRYNGLFSRIETENTKSPMCDLSLCANGIVYHAGLSATVCNIPSLRTETATCSAKPSLQDALVRKENMLKKMLLSNPNEMTVSIFFTFCPILFRLFNDT